MTDRKIQFFTFNEAVDAARNDPDTEFVGLHFVEPFTHLGVYIIRVYSDEPENVNVSFEGGALFDSGGEEDFYSVAEVPAEAKSLFYARRTDLGNGDAQVMGLTSEFVLQEVLPGLSKDAKYRDRAHFMQAAGAEFLAYWRQR
jgi:hypothetical protein